MALKIDRVRYHRNGVCGEGFYVIAFRERQGRKFVPYIGVLFGNPIEEPGKFIAECAVINPADITDTRRGDHYEPSLRAAAIAAHEDDSAYRRD